MYTTRSRAKAIGHALTGLAAVLASAALIWLGDPTPRGRLMAVGVPLVMTAVALWPVRRPVAAPERRAITAAPFDRVRGDLP